MEQRRQMLDSVERGDLTVSEACELWKVSLRRSTCGGAAETLKVSPGWGTVRAGHGGPRPDPPLPESQIVDLRRAHPRWGARRIRVELVRRGVTTVPARSTVHQVLVRNGLVGAPPPKPPERGHPLRALARRTSCGRWTPRRRAAGRHGGEVISAARRLQPLLRRPWRRSRRRRAEAACACSTPQRGARAASERAVRQRGDLHRTGQACVNLFERHLWAHGVYTINGRARHPQTQGKVERYHRTLDEWLTDHGPFDTIDELNASLRRFRHHYNHERPHQGDGMNDGTPAEVFAAAATAGPDPSRPSSGAAARTSDAPHRRATSATASGPSASAASGDAPRSASSTTARRSRSTPSMATSSAHVKPDHTRTYLGTGNPRGRPHRRDNV